MLVFQWSGLYLLNSSLTCQIKASKKCYCFIGQKGGFGSKKSQLS